MEVAIYADLTPVQMLASKTRTFLGGLTRLDALHVNFHSSRNTWRYSEPEWERVVDAYPFLRLRPVAWPRAEWSGEDYARLDAAARYAQQGPVLDLEHQWLRATEEDDARLAAVFPGARITTHLNHPIVTKKRPIARLTKGLEVQALSVASRDGHPVSRNDVLAPPWMQVQARIRGVAARVGPVFLTLPAYNQKFSYGATEAMTLALDGARHSQVLGVSYWSLRHIMRNAYAQTFLRRLPHLLEQPPSKWSGGSEEEGES